MTLVCLVGIFFLGWLIFYAITKDGEKTTICNSLFFGFLSVTFGYFIVISSLFQHPSFIDAKDFPVWFQRSGAALIGCVLYAEYFVNGVLRRASDGGWELIKSQLFRLMHFAIFGISMILGTAIWGYGDLWHEFILGWFSQ